KSNILWLAYEKGKEKFLNNLIPLYYYREEKTESELWFSPTLSYSYKTEEEKIKFTGLGAVYYEKDEIKLNKKSKNVALGALYYETSKPEHKGYKGKGSLWGLLWEHQTESETKFEKISVLKFVYTSVTDENGDKYRRIMGVRI
ncbi:MAG: hypothetical protein KDK36_00935, partial [Leptospiraceae bacterium]|nr:hypothetical protein [Leptospiraceae bacterium]